MASAFGRHALAAPRVDRAPPARVLRPARPWQWRTAGEDLARRAGLHPRPLATPHPAAGDGPRALLSARALARARLLWHVSSRSVPGLAVELSRQEHGAGHLGPARRDDQERAGGRALLLCLPCPACRAGPADPRQRRARAQPRSGHASQSQGVVCASCHVRGHQRFGPPRRDGTVASRAPRESLPHNGLTRTTAFLRSEFCASCHQFAPNGLALNGKLLENTFEEWRASPAARRGQQCQDCHMPDRRHLCAASTIRRW